MSDREYRADALIWDWVFNLCARDVLVAVKSNDAAALEEVVVVLDLYFFTSVGKARRT